MTSASLKRAGAPPPGGSAITRPARRGEPRETSLSRGCGPVRSDCPPTPAGRKCRSRRARVDHRDPAGVCPNSRPVQTRNARRGSASIGCRGNHLCSRAPAFSVATAWPCLGSGVATELAFAVEVWRDSAQRAMTASAGEAGVFRRRSPPNSTYLNGRRCRPRPILVPGVAVAEQDRPNGAICSVATPRRQHAGRTGLAAGSAAYSRALR